jgi:hypothetical protein
MPESEIDGELNEPTDGKTPAISKAMKFSSSASVTAAVFSDG